MARKPRGPEEYTREELMLMAERVNLKYRSRKSKEQLYEELGLGAKPGRSRRPSSRKIPASPPARRPAPARESRAVRAANAPVGLPEGALPELTSSSSGIPLPSLFAPAAQRTGPYIDRGPDLPAGYGDDVLEALVRDPRAIYVYWELAGGAHARACANRSEAELAGAVWVLRVSRLEDDNFFDIPVDPGVGNWYLHVDPDGSYQVRIGLVLASGSFIELAASRVVRTPPDSVSERQDEQWMLVSEEFDRLVDYTVSLHGRAPGSAQMGELRRRREALRRKVAEFPWNISSCISSAAVSSWMTSPRGGGPGAGAAGKQGR
ncbi:MAG TPA: DUF4912 domain-containing protein [Planctomycetota bacterium]|nr:DUF4912 domain-containing protein [Planctomycetota bacterium]